MKIILQEVKVFHLRLFFRKTSQARMWVYPSIAVRNRWRNLRDPPDWVAVSITTEGLKPFFLSRPPMRHKDNSPFSVVTSPEKFSVLIPHVEQWVRSEFVT